MHRMSTLQIVLMGWSELTLSARHSVHQCEGPRILEEDSSDSKLGKSTAIYVTSVNLWVCFEEAELHFSDKTKLQEVMSPIESTE